MHHAEHDCTHSVQPSGLFTQRDLAAGLESLCPLASSGRIVRVWLERASLSSRRARRSQDYRSTWVCGEILGKRAGRCAKLIMQIFTLIHSCKERARTCSSHRVHCFEYISMLWSCAERPALWMSVSAQLAQMISIETQPLGLIFHQNAV